MRGVISESEFPIESNIKLVHNATRTLRERIKSFSIFGSVVYETFYY